MKESTIQQSCIQALSSLSVANNFIFFAPMNESAMMVLKMFKVPDKTCARIMNWFRKMGFLPGVSDIVIIHNGQACFIELKTETGKVSEKQVLFMDNATKAGGRCAVVRSLDGMLGCLRGWEVIG